MPNCENKTVNNNIEISFYIIRFGRFLLINELILMILSIKKLISLSGPEKTEMWDVHNFQ